jgi:hypothetical protein
MEIPSWQEIICLFFFFLLLSFSFSFFTKTQLMPSLALSTAEDKNRVRRALPTAVRYLEIIYIYIYNSININ